jgi:hypothetical protein
LLLASDRECTLKILAFAASGTGDLSAISPAMRLTSASHHLSFFVSIVVVASPM